jgi:hypothetical protein
MVEDPLSATILMCVNCRLQIWYQDVKILDREDGTGYYYSE